MTSNGKGIKWTFSIEDGYPCYHLADLASLGSESIFLDDLGDGRVKEQWEQLVTTSEHYLCIRSQNDSLLVSRLPSESCTIRFSALQQSKLDPRLHGAHFVSGVDSSVKKHVLFNWRLLVFTDDGFYNYDCDHQTISKIIYSPCSFQFPFQIEAHDSFRPISEKYCTAMKDKLAIQLKEYHFLKCEFLDDSIMLYFTLDCTGGNTLRCAYNFRDAKLEDAEFCSLLDGQSERMGRIWSVLDGCISRSQLSIYSPPDENFFAMLRENFQISSCVNAFDREKRRFGTIGGEDVFNFPMLSLMSCFYLVNEIEALRRAEADMVLDRDGVTLEEHGFKLFLACLTEAVFSPLMHLLFGTHATHINSFIVKYEMEGDREHFLHTDGSAFTLNVCLGTKFEGGDLILHDNDGNTLSVPRIPGYGIIHRGTIKHETKPILSGNRYSLVVWLGQKD